MAKKVLGVKEAMRHYVSTLDDITTPATTIKGLTKQIMGVEEGRTIAEIYEAAAIAQGYVPDTEYVVSRSFSVSDITTVNVYTDKIEEDPVTWPGASLSGIMDENPWNSSGSDFETYDRAPLYSVSIDGVEYKDFTTTVHNTQATPSYWFYQVVREGEDFGFEVYFSGSSAQYPTQIAFYDEEPTAHEVVFTFKPQEEPEPDSDTGTVGK